MKTREKEREHVFKRKQRETGAQEEAGEYATFSAFGCFVSPNCPCVVPAQLPLNVREVKQKFPPC